jgi:competence protein ComFA
MSPPNNIPFWSTKLDQQILYQYTGKLLLEQEIPPDIPLIQEHFMKIPSIKHTLFYQECLRCGNQQSHLFGKIPCARCKKTHYYCRNCIEMGRVMECTSLYYWIGAEPKWPVYESPLTWKGTLTSYQLEASNRIVQAIQQVEHELLVWAVCGAGKTEMLFHGIEAGLQQGKRICIATPRADVVRELKPRIQAAFQNVPVQALFGGSEEKEGFAPLIIATTHQLLRYYKAFDVMIIDEVDAFPYHQDRSLIFAVNRAKKNESTTIYLTATPRKSLQMKVAFHRIPHVFVPVRYHGKPLPVPKLKTCYTLKKDITYNRIPKMMKNWLAFRKNPKRQVLIFVPTISLADELGEKHREFADLGFTTIASVHSNDSLRVEKIDQFRHRKLDLLITTTILERGVTFPSVDVIVLDAGHTVFDEAALVQIAGRAGRSADDPTGEVLFLHDGKTEAMVNAIRSIKMMNQKGGFIS